MPRKKNRRKERRSVLDVKLSAGQLRRQRVRVAFQGSVMLGLLLALGAAVWFGGRVLVERYVYRNPAFLVKHVRMTTDGILRTEPMVQLAGIRPGQNLFRLDLKQARANLGRVSLIKDVSIRRIPPDTLEIRLTERRPVLRIERIVMDRNFQTRQVEFGLDSEGKILLMDESLTRDGAGEAWQRLPLITGMEPGDLMAGRAHDNPEVRAAGGFMEAFRSSPISRKVAVESIDVSRPVSLKVHDRSGGEVVLLPREFEGQFGRWLSILNYLEQSPQYSWYSWIDVSVTNSVPALLIPAAGAPPNNTLSQAVTGN